MHVVSSVVRRFGFVVRVIYGAVDLPQVDIMNFRAELVDEGLFRKSNGAAVFIKSLF